jgi:uncharacterized membrane protein (UPF0127 family)
MSDGPRVVRVENVTRGTVVGDRVRVASTSLDRSVGLLRTPELLPGEGLWIERSPSIHMFFMPYAIDAVFVSKAGRVTKVAAGLRPWRIVPWARGARDCLELPAGQADATGTRVGDELRVVEAEEEAGEAAEAGG